MIWFDQFSDGFVTVYCPGRLVFFFGDFPGYGTNAVFSQTVIIVSYLFVKKGIEVVPQLKMLRILTIRQL
jgi:hypothetical protein